jgi:TrwC relaxase
MTLHKLHAGDGYTYLTRQVAAGDEGRSPGQQLADYYTASGNPPGRWVGAGAADLAVTGRVREDQMRALFGRGLHPDAAQIVALERAAGAGQVDAEPAAKLGRAFPQYTQLPPRAERVAARLARFEAENGHPPTPAVRSKIEAQEGRRERRAVAGYDLVFTPVITSIVADRFVRVHADHNPLTMRAHRSSDARSTNGHRAGRATLLRVRQTLLEHLLALRDARPRRPNESHTTSVGSRNESDEPGAWTEPCQVRSYKQ